MTTESRIKSILKANNLDYSITGFRTFDLADFIFETDLRFKLPNSLRLGHLAEKIVSEAIRESENCEVLYENVQVIEGGKTIGEIDFIVEDHRNQEILHVELAYKFYLYDPSISSELIQNWIGPNRNDSLKEKLTKLKQKQFPLLQHSSTRAMLNEINIDDVHQALCFLVSLYIPYQFKIKLHPAYQEAVKGYYVNMETFKGLHNGEKSYYIPPKKEWGIDPKENSIWLDLSSLDEQIMLCLREKKAPLIWQNYKESFTQFFIVWW